MLETFSNKLLWMKLTHETGGEVGVRTDLAVNFNEPLHDDLGDFRVGQCILKTVSKENDQG